MMAFQEKFTAARRVGVPITVVSSVDQFGTVSLLREPAGGDKAPLVKWDAAGGMTAINDLGIAALAQAKITPDDTYEFAVAMVKAQDLPKGTVVFVMNAHLQLNGEGRAVAQGVQAVANLRDQFKTNYRMAVLLQLDTKVPSELDQDVVALVHDFPTDEELRKVVTEVYESAAQQAARMKQPMKPLAPAILTRAADAVSGLSEFAAEQQASLALVNGEFNIDTMWELKRIALKQDGLESWMGREKFSDIVGLDAAKEHLNAIMDTLGVVVFIDEIDKQQADPGDGNNTRTDQLAVTLSEMEDNEYEGMLLVGPGGGGKSLLGKALGNEAGVPTIRLDYGSMLHKWVGDSEERIRRAFRRIKRLGRGRAYFVATSNGATPMRPEMRRRFTDGAWMVDLMDEAGLRAAFKFYAGKYGLTAKQAALDFDFEGWSAAECRNACRTAAKKKITLAQQSKFVVPSSRGQLEELDALRRMASGRMLDATKGGAYSYTPMSERQAKMVMQKQVRSTGGLDGVLGQ